MILSVLYGVSVDGFWLARTTRSISCTQVNRRLTDSQSSVNRSELPILGELRAVLKVEYVGHVIE